jgi:hypothetical protein
MILEISPKTRSYIEESHSEKEFVLAAAGCTLFTRAGLSGKAIGRNCSFAM